MRAYKYFTQLGFSYDLIKSEGNKIILEIFYESNEHTKKINCGYEVMCSLLPNVDYYDLGDLLNTAKLDHVVEIDGCVIITKRFNTLQQAMTRFNEIDAIPIVEQERSTVDDLNASYLSPGCRKTIPWGSWYYEQIWSK